jgi:hypothetical protein
VKVRSIAQGIQIQGKVDCLGSAGVRVKQLLARALQEVLDGLLSNAILEVGVHARKGELLSSIVACLSEGVVMKAPIVTVVMEYFHPMFGSVLFKSKLGSECFS